MGSDLTSRPLDTAFWVSEACHPLTRPGAGAAITERGLQFADVPSLLGSFVGRTILSCHSCGGPRLHPLLHKITPWQHGTTHSKEGEWPPSGEGTCGREGRGGHHPGPWRKGAVRQWPGPGFLPQQEMTNFLLVWQTLQQCGMDGFLGPGVQSLPSPLNSL